MATNEWTVKHAHKTRRPLTTWTNDPKALNKNSFHTVHELTQVVDLWKKAANLSKSSSLFFAMLFKATYTVCVDNLLVFSLRLYNTLMEHCPVRQLNHCYIYGAAHTIKKESGSYTYWGRRIVWEY